MTNLGKISDALCDIAEAINQIKDAVRQITDAICEAIPALIDVISDVMRAGKKQKRPRYLPVRYICAADRPLDQDWRGLPGILQHFRLQRMRANDIP